MISLYINLVKDREGGDLIKVGQTENLTNRLNYSKEYFDSVVSLKVYNLEGVDWRSLEEDLHNTHKEC